MVLESNVPVNVPVAFSDLEGKGLQVPARGRNMGLTTATHSYFPKTFYNTQATTGPTAGCLTPKRKSQAPSLSTTQVKISQVKISQGKFYDWHLSKLAP